MPKPKFSPKVCQIETWNLQAAKFIYHRLQMQQQWCNRSKGCSEYQWRRRRRVIYIASLVDGLLGSLLLREALCRKERWKINTNLLMIQKLTRNRLEILRLLSQTLGTAFVNSLIEPSRAEPSWMWASHWARKVPDKSDFVCVNLEISANYRFIYCHAELICGGLSSDQPCCCWSDQH